MSDQHQTNVVIITGHPATGKTTLAMQLAADLQWPLLYKDRIKEQLYEVLGGGDREWHNQLGRASFDLLYGQSAVLLKASLPHVVEANFSPRYADQPWRSLQATYPFRAVQILCHADVKVIKQRYLQRIEDGLRHPAHFDARESDVVWNKLREPAGWLDLSGERLFLDTTQLNDSITEAIITEVKALMSPVE